MNMNHIRRSLSAVCCIAALLLCTACAEEESSVALPGTQSTSSSEEATTTTTAATTTTSAEEQTTTTSASSTSEEGTTTTTTETTVSSTTTTTTTTTGQIVDTNGYLLDVLTIGGDCTAYVTQHKNHALQEAPSCMGEGTDRVYIYEDFTLYTFFDGTTDMVVEINIQTDAIATREGATVFMTRSEVEALHGTSADNTYLTQDGTLEFTYADNTVIMIALYNPF